MGVPGAARELVRQVQPGQAGADQAIRRCGLGRVTAGGGPVEQRGVGQFPVAAGPAVRRQDLAVGYGQLVLGHAEPGRGRGQVPSPGLRADQAKRGAGVLDGKAAGGVTLVGTQAGDRRHHPHPGEADVQFLGGHLGQRGQHALPELDLARAYLDDAGRQHAQPVAEPRVRRDRGRQRDVLRRVHAVPSGSARSSAAASSTAETMRLCAPHRHRLPSRAARTSSPEGSALRRSRPTAAMITPDKQ